MGNGKDYFYINFMASKKSKQYRCRVQLNGKRWIKYFDTNEEAEAYRKEINAQKKKIYKKGDIKYLSLKTLLDEYLKFKSADWSPSTTYQNRNSFYQIFKDHYDDWFHLITKESCEMILDKENNRNRMQAFYAFQVLNEVNKFSLDKHKYGLDWSVEILRKQIKIIRGQRKKPREFHLKNEIKSISNFLKNHDGSLFKDTENLFHVYRLGLSLGCRASELCSLKKKNFNKETKTLLINSTLSRSIDHHWYDSQITKTKTSRINQLSNSAINSIEWLIGRSETDFIIGNFTSRSKLDFLTIDIISARFKPILKHLGIPWIGTHGMFRKTFATQIAQASTKTHRDMIASIQKQLGHKSPQMTLHYIQAVDTDLTDELSVLDDLV